MLEKEIGKLVKKFHHHKDLPVKFSMRIGPVHERPFQKGRNSMLVLKDNQQVPLAVMGVDAAGNTVALPNPPSWSLAGSNPEIITLTPSADGMSAEVSATGKLGTAQVVVSDVVGTGTIQGILDIQVVAGDLAGINVTAGTPTAIQAAAASASSAAAPAASAATPASGAAAPAQATT